MRRADNKFARDPAAATVRELNMAAGYGRSNRLSQNSRVENDLKGVCDAFPHKRENARYTAL